MTDNQEAFDLVKGSQKKQALAAKKNAIKHLSPQEELLLHRVTPETKLPPLEFLFKMNGTECFPLSELVATNGKAKSGKTLFLSIVMACCLKKNVLGLERIREEPIRVLWYDTEQSAQSTQRILVKRIVPMSEYQSALDDQFFVFNVRGMGWEKRRELLSVAIETYKPDLVIVDGIKDLLTDINDGTQATLVVEDQMGLAQTHNCCIVDVLHQNKSDADRNMRGWIGTELTNKAFEVWSCAIVPNTDTFKVEHTMSRMKRSEENLYYKLNEEALPVPCDKPDEQPREPNGRFASKKKPETDKTQKPQYQIDWAKLNRDYILSSSTPESTNDAGSAPTEKPVNPEDIPWDLVKLFTDAMEGYVSKRFSTLMATTMRITNIEDNKYYYHLLERAEKEHILARGKDGSGQQCFYLNSPEQRQRILAHEEEERRKQQEPQQTTIYFTENDEPAPF